MKNTTTQLTVLFIISLLILVSCTGNEQKTTSSQNTPKWDTTLLFNGKNLDGLKIVMKDSTANPDTVWFVKDNILCSSGNPFGYIHTENEYKNYKLIVEWRWPEKAGNSGVFLHKKGQDKIWPTCIEAQLFHEHAGDLITMGGTSFNELTDTSTIVYNKQHEETENEPGKWNTYEITCSNDTIIAIVNDTFQNKATGVSVQSGQICLQSEGTPIEFKSFYILTKEE